MGLTLGRVFGTDIRAHWSWVIILAFVSVSFGLDLSDGAAASWPIAVAWSASIATAALIFASVLAHELGHVIVARRNGQTVPVASVQLLGGPYIMEVKPRTAGEELRIALAGSFVSLVIAVPFTVVASILYLGPFDNAPDAVQALGLVTAMMAGFNIFVCVLNLLPGYPMDGARVMHALIWMRTRREDAAMEISLRIGRYVGIALIGTGAVTIAVADPLPGFCLVIAGWLIMSSSRVLDRRGVVQSLVDGLHVSDALDTNPAKVPPQLTLDNYALEFLGERSGSAALVERDGELLGLVGSVQIRRVPRNKWPQTRTEKVMVAIASVPTVSADADLWPVLEVLERTGLDAMLVTGLDAGAETVPEAAPEAGIVLVSRRSSARLVHERAEARQREMLAAGLIRKGRFRGR